MLLQASHKCAPVHGHALREDQDMHQALRVKLPGQDFSGLKEAHALLECETPPPQHGVFKVNRGRHQSFVEYRGPHDFASRRTAQEKGSRIRCPQLV
jgi:hypothetical protein